MGLSRQAMAIMRASKRVPTAWQCDKSVILQAASRLLEHNCRHIHSLTYIYICRFIDTHTRKHVKSYKLCILVKRKAYRVGQSAKSLSVRYSCHSILATPSCIYVCFSSLSLSFLSYFLFPLVYSIEFWLSSLPKGIGNNLSRILCKNLWVLLCCFCCLDDVSSTKVLRVQ